MFNARGGTTHVQASSFEKTTRPLVDVVASRDLLIFFRK